MVKKIIRKLLYSRKVQHFFHHNNFMSNYILSLSSVFQRKFIKLSKRNFHKTNQKSQSIKKSDLNISGNEFKFAEYLDDSINLKEMNSVAGYVPFQKNCTKVLLYNFFSKNYSIRKQLLGTIYLSLIHI